MRQELKDKINKLDEFQEKFSTSLVSDWHELAKTLYINYNEKVESPNVRYNQVLNHNT